MIKKQAKKMVQISFRMDSDLKDQLTELAVKDNRSLNSYVANELKKLLWDKSTFN